MIKICLDYIQPTKGFHIQITSITDNGDSTYTVESSLLDAINDFLIGSGTFSLVKNNKGIVAEKYPYYLINLQFKK